MARLVLGPLLRHVGEAEATIWVETDAPAQVEVLGHRARTFCVDGHHFALVVARDLRPGASYEYEVRVDGERAWPADDEPLPSPALRTLGGNRPLRIVFGSCRVSVPHEPPYVQDAPGREGGHGVDALRALALRLTRAGPQERPDLLLMLGDQVYADELSPHMREVVDRRGRAAGEPDDELVDFEEYAAAYREAWSEPLVRWLLATVPTAMIFDDHEIHAEWKISAAWEATMRDEPWFERRIAAGMAAYWVYQHLGNLPPADLDDSELLARVCAVDDGGAVLREVARDADRQPGHSRWSFCRDLGRTRLIVVDSRAGRVLQPGRREMVDDGEWAWIEEHATGDFEHLLLASSVPFLLPHGLHGLERWNEAVCAGAWGPVAARAGEWIRQAGVLDHWASFGRSFHRLAGLLERIATGATGRPPVSVTMLSGDVHHCYLARVGFRRGLAPRSAVWQVVCSPYRKHLAPRERAIMRFGRSRPARLLGRALARAVGTAPDPIGWRLVEEPSYDNQLGTLTLGPDHAGVAVETTVDSDWREPSLRMAFEHDLLSRGPGA
ncbi:MAG TPA: alkaline phosphatase D family protein [Solirubrobacteraceae bacterium]|nr:alkaline phosphatase D family protein [Solirubrobacteraceae bacterium]